MYIVFETFIRKCVWYLENGICTFARSIHIHMLHLVGNAQNVIRIFAEIYTHRT